MGGWARALGRAVGAVAALAMLPRPALTHSAAPGVGDFYAGMLHPVTALEHALPFAALGLLVGQQGTERAYNAVLVFPVALAVGAYLTRLVPSLPGVWSVNIASAVLLGGLVAAARPVPVSLLHGLAVLFGLTHGYAHGDALAETARPSLFIAGLAVAGGLVLAYGIGLVMQLRPFWARVAVRVAGSWIAATGLLVLGLTLKAPAP